MNFKEAGIFGSYISKAYAEDIFRLLLSYQSVSASEVASRLDMHIRTVQDFLEAMALLGILDKDEVYEKKRPYFRYTLKTKNISFRLDLNELLKNHETEVDLEARICEKKNSGMKFTTARSGQYFSSVTVFIGKGREVVSRTVSLTLAQGKFLYNLPFPGAKALSIKEIMDTAGVDQSYASEMIDIVNLLFDLKVILKKD